MTSPEDANPSGFPKAVWAWVLVWIIIAVLAVLWGINNEEDDLTQRATETLSGTDLEVEFDGRDATILGTGNLATIDSAAETILDLRGVRRVSVGETNISAPSSQTTPSTAAPQTISTTTAAPTTTTAAPATTAPEEVADPNFIALYSGGSVELFGTMPSQDVISAIETSAEDTYGVDNVVSMLEVGEVSSRDYLAGLPGLFSVAEGLDPWDFAVDADTIVFNGLAPSDEAANATRSAFDSFVTSSGLDEAEVAVETNPEAVAASLTDLLAAGANFETASSRLSADATTRLDTVVEILLANPSTVVTVEGHTDDQGSAPANQSLSEERAQAVVDYLVEGGVGAERLVAVGYGEERPIADNDTADGRAMNRRIEFVVNEGEGS